MNYSDDEICQKHLAATSEERPCRECLSEELTKTKQLLATAVEIIESIIDNDGDRYNRPRYYYKCADFLNSLEGK